MIKTHFIKLSKKKTHKNVLEVMSKRGSDWQGHSLPITFLITETKHLRKTGYGRFILIHGFSGLLQSVMAGMIGCSLWQQLTSYTQDSSTTHKGPSSGTTSGNHDPPPNSSTASQMKITSWGAGVQSHEPMGAISQLNPNTIKYGSTYDIETLQNYNSLFLLN